MRVLANLHDTPNCEQDRNDKGYPRYIRGYVVRPIATDRRLIILTEVHDCQMAKINTETAA